MSRASQINTMRISIFLLSLFASALSNAWDGDGHGYHHGHDEGYRHGGYGYNNGHGYYGRGRGWGGPNIVINVPPARGYYVPRCQVMDVCDSYGQCWLQRYCD